ncbi:MAG: D-alanyl-D-alanine carboxypeptidase [Oscillatoriales cyanobacterium SM2_2_1]|nr:D-alanyl-D-alanine carboxypeptidase [Oscillatoriales cyanobacterium SM2_2_1]
MNLVSVMLLAIAPQMLHGRDVASLPQRVVQLLNPPTLATRPGQEPTAEQATQQMLRQLRQAGYPEAGQGIWLQTHDGTLLSQRLGTQPLPVASLTKIPTTLAALHVWGAGHRFITEVATDGELVGDTLRGNLIIGGGGDPLFVWEDAIALGNTLNQLGIRQVQGDLIIRGRFQMNFEEDRRDSAARLREGIQFSRWGAEAQKQFQTMPRGTARPSVGISGKTVIANQPLTLTGLSGGSPPVRLLVRRRSLPLWQILKQMNIYSNNIIADSLAADLGGGTAIARLAAELTRIPAAEIRLINGSGLGQSNQISPRATVALLMATHNRAQVEGLTVADLFPMADCRCGTLKNRTLPQGAILKTGTLSDVSTLAGVVQTRDRGLVWFALINRGSGEIDVFHRSQGTVLSSLNRQWGSVRTLQPLPFVDGDRSEIINRP